MSELHISLEIWTRGSQRVKEIKFEDDVSIATPFREDESGKSQLMASISRSQRHTKGGDRSKPNDKSSANNKSVDPRMILASPSPPLKNRRGRV